MRVRLLSLVLGLGLVVPTLTRADAIYTLKEPASAISWSFDVPAVITTTTTITTFLSKNVAPGGFWGTLGCPVIDSVKITDPTGNNPSVTTFLSGAGCPGGGQDFIGFAGPISAFGTYSVPGNTFSLTISAVPEPSSLLLLGTGLLAAVGAVRRKLLS